MLAGTPTWRSSAANWAALRVDERDLRADGDIYAVHLVRRKPPRPNPRVDLRVVPGKATRSNHVYSDRNTRLIEAHFETSASRRGMSASHCPFCVVIGSDGQLARETFGERHSARNKQRWLRRSRCSGWLCFRRYRSTEARLVSQWECRSRHAWTAPRCNSQHRRCPGRPNDHRRIVSAFDSLPCPGAPKTRGRRLTALLANR